MYINLLYLNMSYFTYVGQTFKKYFILFYLLNKQYKSTIFILM